MKKHRHRRLRRLQKKREKQRLRKQTKRNRSYYVRWDRPSTSAPPDVLFGALRRRLKLGKLPDIS